MAASPGNGNDTALDADHVTAAHVAAMPAVGAGRLNILAEQNITTFLKWPDAERPAIRILDHFRKVNSSPIKGSFLYFPVPPLMAPRTAHPMAGSQRIKISSPIYQGVTRV